MAWHGHKLEARSEASAAGDVDLPDFTLGVSGALCRRKRRFSFKTLRFKTPFSCQFLGLRCVKCGFLRFLSFSNSSVDNCSACRLVLGHRRARLETKPGYRAPTHGTAAIFAYILLLFHTAPAGLVSEFGTFLTLSCGITCRSPGVVYSTSECFLWHGLGTLQHGCALPRELSHQPRLPDFWTSSTSTNAHFRP